MDLLNNHTIQPEQQNVEENAVDCSGNYIRPVLRYALRDTAVF